MGRRVEESERQGTLNHPRAPNHQGSPPQMSTSCQLPLLSRCPRMSPKGASHLHKGNAQGCCSHHQHVALQPDPNLLHTALKGSRQIKQGHHQKLPSRLPCVPLSLRHSLYLPSSSQHSQMPSPSLIPNFSGANPLHLYPWFLSSRNTSQVSQVPCHCTSASSLPQCGCPSP